MRDLMFGCGACGGVWVPDKHDEAGQRYADEQNVRHFQRTGEYASLDQQVDWMLEGSTASRRHMTMREYDAVRAAAALLEKHGYSVREPDEPREGETA